MVDEREREERRQTRTTSQEGNNILETETSDREREEKREKK